MASREDYLDLNYTYLFKCLRITNASGRNLANDAEGFINYPECTLFSQVDIMLGDRLITQSSNMYPYCILNV